jgi:hypothetical protein
VTERLPSVPAYYLFWTAIVAITLLANGIGLWWISKVVRDHCHHRIDAGREG